MTGSFSIRVSSYAGYRSEETPRSFQLGKHLVEITEVMDRWLDPAHRYFKVRGDDTAVYILRHDCESDFWQLVFFDRDGQMTTPAFEQSRGTYPDRDSALI